MHGSNKYELTIEVGTKSMDPPTKFPNTKYIRMYKVGIKGN